MRLTGCFCWQVVVCGFLVLSSEVVADPEIGETKVLQSYGVDQRVDYAALTEIGPWDDRNYALTEEDLAYLSPNEHEQREPIPAFFRVELRKEMPHLRRSGPAQYPRSALQLFERRYGVLKHEGEGEKDLVEGQAIKPSTQCNGTKKRHNHRR